MKRNAIDSDNYFREIFKPLLEPLNTLSKKNERSVSNDFPNGKVNTEIRDTSDKDDDSTLLNTTFINFLNTRPQSRRYDRPYGLYYDGDNNQLKISDNPVSISHDNLHLLKKYYPWTIGLWSL